MKNSKLEQQTPENSEDELEGLDEIPKKPQGKPKKPRTQKQIEASLKNLAKSSNKGGRPRKLPVIEEKKVVTKKTPIIQEPEEDFEDEEIQEMPPKRTRKNNNEDDWVGNLVLKDSSDKRQKYRFLEEKLDLILGSIPKIEKYVDRMYQHKKAKIPKVHQLPVENNEKKHDPRFDTAVDRLLSRKIGK